MFDYAQNRSFLRVKRTNAYSVLIDHVDDDDKPAVFLSVVHEGNPADLHISLERLQDHRKSTQPDQLKSKAREH
ncbi:hypothetical protein BHE74_00012609 [Ensete ventricosum]|nr:hypothetical protein BHE74_00012609 [Ensete ventricosum]RZR91392.1 hypothetical protein BHM03_00019504 [Ensete ventricosum]